ASPDGTVDLDSLAPTSIVNSNIVSIAALANIAGGETSHLVTLPDDEFKIHESLERHVDHSDLIITTGGTSVGEKDLLPVIFGKHYKTLYHGIAMKPGSATLLGLARRTPVACLSGFPVAAEVAMLYFVMPSIRKIGGQTDLDPRITVHARLDRAVPVKGFGVTRMLRVKLGYDPEHDDALPVATPLKLSGSSAQRSMIESAGIVEIPPNIEGYEANAIVRVKLHPR
nr:molybdopterin-binding protein [Candidatus Sigynarchaeota archaeon]